MQITEPATLITDYLLTFASLMFALALLRQVKAQQQTSTLLWCLAFVASGLASFFGGTYHGFILHMSPTTQFVVWRITVYAISLAGFLMLWAALVVCASAGVRRFVLVLALVKMAVYGVWMWSHDDFSYVIMDYVPSMVLVLIWHAIAVTTQQAAAHRWVVAGVLVSFIAAGVQGSDLALGVLLNHNDLYHIIQLVGLYLLYRGACVVRDRVAG